MEKNKPEIVFTFPAIMGGVASFNFNLINNSSLIKRFHSKVILMKELTDTRPLFTEKFDVDEEILFEYSDKENQYHLQKRLSKLLGKGEGAVVTDNGLTMETARRFNNPKTIYSLIHDYYYVTQQIKLRDLADVAIAHSSFFSDAVFSALPQLFANRCFYLPYGVKQLPSFPQKMDGALNLIFVGRLVQEKGVLQLYEIEKELQLLIDTLVSDNELETVKSYMLGSFVGDIQTPFAIADKYKTIYFYGLGYNYYERFFSRIQSITATDIQNVAKKYFAPSEMSYVIAGGF